MKQRNASCLFGSLRAVKDSREAAASQLPSRGAGWWQRWCPPLEWSAHKEGLMFSAAAGGCQTVLLMVMSESTRSSEVLTASQRARRCRQRGVLSAEVCFPGRSWRLCNKHGMSLLLLTVSLLTPRSCWRS